ncbi:MAG TPA: AEC family transporter [Gaiellaceae bacterium]|jgi:malate permease and related proteins
MLKLSLLLVALLVGLLLQRLRSQERLRDLIWIVSFWIVIPVLVFATFLNFPLNRKLVLAVLAAIASTWTLLLLSYLYARLVTRERDEQGALTLAAGIGNTGFIGYPLAQLAFGHQGLSQAVVYDQLAFGVPMSSISVVVARLFGRRSVDTEGRSRLATVLLNPPLWTLAAALLLRLAGVHIPHIRTVEDGAAALVGPMGFLMLGISLPLEQFEHDLREVARATGAIALKIGAGPLILFLLGRAIGAHIPATFYLLAAMPTAFHLLTLARVYDMRPALMRLMIVASTIPVVIAVVVGSFIF